MKSVPSASVLIKSPPGMPSLSCTVILSMLATHPVNCTFLYRCLLVCLQSQTHSCATHTVTTVSQMCFNCTSFNIIKFYDMDMNSLYYNHFRYVCIINSSCLSVQMYQHGSHWTDYHEI
jgi:hypothetical protein